MHEASLESHFERYRSCGDLEALAVVFDRSAPALLALAAHLVRDPSAAEDLVQATFVAAIEGARSFDAARRLEPWLAGILARQAARALRERARRPDPARLGRATGADPSSLAEQRELRAALERGLSELAPPTLAALEPYLAGERPLDIARASGRAPGTVRMQILRGLERLRRSLPTGLFGVVPLARLPRGLTALKAEVLSHGGAALGASTAAALAGGLAVSSKLVFGALAAAALAVLVLFASSRSPRPPEESVARAPSAASEPPSTLLAAPPAGLLEPARSPAVIAEPASAESAGASPTGSTAVRKSGAVLSGALLGLDGLDPELVRISATERGALIVEGAGTRDARYRLELSPFLDAPEGVPPALYVTAVHPAGRRASLEFSFGERVQGLRRDASIELTLDLDLRQRTAIIGRVLTCAGIEPESVHVALMPVPAHPAASVEPVAEGECDEDGGFALYPELAGEYLVVARSWRALPVARRARAFDGQVSDAGVLALELGGVAIEGVVRTPFEAALGSWRVAAVRADGEEGGSWNGLAFQGQRPVVVEGLDRLTPDGRFRIAGLEPGPYTLRLEQEDGREIVLAYPALTVAAPAAGVRLGESYGRVRARVSAVGGSCSGAQLRVLLEDGHIARSVACGEVVDLIADRRMPLSLEAAAAGFASAHAELPALARPVEESVELVLSADAALASLELDWSLRPGLRGPDWVTAHWRRGGEEGEASVRAGEQGCRFEDWAPGRYRVVLETRGKDFWELSTSSLCTPAFEVELVAGRSAHARCEWTNGGGARFAPSSAPGGAGRQALHAEVRDALGQALAVRFVQREYADGALHIGSYTGSIPLFGPSELQPKLPPGPYELVLSEDELELLRLPFTIVAGETLDVPFVVP